MINFKNCNEAEKFFLSCLGEQLFYAAQYDYLPSCTCFSYCMNELVRNCKIYLETHKKINHLELTEDFYEYMKKDVIFKLIDESQYYVLLNWLKEVSAKSANIEEGYTYFVKTRNIYSGIYINKVKEEITLLLRNDSKEFEKIEDLTSIFINELLSQKLSYLYFVSIYYEFQRKDNFTSLYEFIDYLFNENDTENIEMYLPLKDCTSRDIEFLKSKQEIVQLEDGVYYCKIYNNCVDYYELCEKNRRRIESLLNFFKFYRDSNIDFDYSGKVKIIRRKIEDQFDIPFKTLLTYKFFCGKDSIIKQTIHNLDCLDKNNNILYYKINNILHYAEKDNDILNSSSYVDNWIALESLVKLSEVHSGYDGVKYYIPKLLAVKYFRQELNATLKRAYYKGNVLTVEEFIKCSIDDEGQKICEKAKNKYYEYRLKKYSNIIKDYAALSVCITNIQKRLEKDIERIYLIRNEYVHSSNINVANNMQKIKLKRILADTIDCFNKSLNANVSNGYHDVTGRDIFSDLERKYLVEKITMDLFNGKVNHGEKIGKKQIVSELNKAEIICNIVFERRTTLNRTTYMENKAEEWNEDKINA